MKIKNKIDQLVLETLEKKGIIPSDDCTDETFLRRVFLDLTGTLPSIEEAKKFLYSKSSSKREDLISYLLEKKEFADYWSMKWCDLLRVKSEFPIKLWPNAVQAYARFIRDSLRKNKPYDSFVKELLTASGSNFRSPAVNFYRAVTEKTPLKIAEAVALNFMGVRISKWNEKKQQQMAAFFSKIGYKPTSEWKEEIVFFDRSKVFPVEPVFPDGIKPDISSDIDPRKVFVDWLVRKDNPWFVKNIVNRIFSWLLGRGIIHEPDDIREDNPPSIPELLLFLEEEMISHNFDIKHIFRIITESSTYQRSSLFSKNNQNDNKFFSRYYPRRLEAEVLIDAICSVTDTSEEYFSPIPEPFTFIPWKQRSILLADGSITSPFLEMFGRPPRDTGYESERNNDISVFQILHLLNSRHILSKIREGSGIRRISAGAERNTAVKNIYLAILSRNPSEEEKRYFFSYMTKNKLELNDALNDLVWALFNSKEFLFRH